LHDLRRNKGGGIIEEGIRIFTGKGKRRTRKRKRFYYPSTLGSCLRKQYYTYTLGERITSEELVIFTTEKGVYETAAKAFGEVAKVENGRKAFLSKFHLLLN